MQNFLILCAQQARNWAEDASNFNASEIRLRRENDRRWSRLSGGEAAEQRAYGERRDLATEVSWRRVGLLLVHRQR
jgi:hypothetical protein